MDSEIKAKIEKLLEGKGKPLTGFNGTLFKIEKDKRKRIANLMNVSITKGTKKLAVSGTGQEDFEYKKLPEARKLIGIIILGFLSPKTYIEKAKEMELELEKEVKIKLKELYFFPTPEIKGNKIEDVIFTSTDWD